MEVLRAIAAANYGKSGITAMKISVMEKIEFQALQLDVVAFFMNQNPSVVNEKGHVTNWTRPYGEALQFSLWNSHGDPMNWKDDHNCSPMGKSFHHAEMYPRLAEFISRWPNLCNFRLNVMKAKSGLSPHKEQIVIWKGNVPIVKVRFHLPIITTPEAYMMLNWKHYRFEPGTIYFFNNGVPHCSHNPGSKERMHLVWDMLCSEQLYKDYLSKAKILPYLGVEDPKEGYPAESPYVSEKDSERIVCV